MERESSPETDDELFNDIYGKAYTGPVKSAPPNSAGNNNNSSAAKKALPVQGPGSDEEDGLKEPNAIPTDFTSRDSRAWEAKAKATERNWKQRLQEEMICKLCGDPGHFTQGCPSTLGAGKKTSEYFERVAARDPLVRALFPPKLISDIETETGCKITMNEKFLFVSAKEPSFLSRGINRIHDMIQSAKEKTINISPRSLSRSRSRSPRVRNPSPRTREVSPKGRDRERSPSRRAPSPSKRGPSPSRRAPSPRGRGVSPKGRERSPSSRGGGSSPRRKGTSPTRSRERSPPKRSYSPRRERSGSQRLHSPRGDQTKSYGGRSFGDRAREDASRVGRASPHDYPKYGGSRSPARHPQPHPQPQNPSDAYNNRQYGGQNRNSDTPLTSHKVSGWDVGGQNMPDTGPERDLLKAKYPRTLEELELEFNRESMEMIRARDQEVDEENYKHREKIREMRQTYTSNISTLRSAHSKQWDSFLQQNNNARQPPSHAHPPHGSYPPPNAYTDLADPRNNSPYNMGPSSGVPQSMYYGVDGTNAYSAAHGHPYGRY